MIGTKVFKMELTIEDHEILQEALQKICDNHKISYVLNDDVKTDSFYYDIVTTTEDFLRHLKNEI